MSRTSNAVKDKWNTANYDDIRIRVPKGQKQAIQAAADEVGESINQYTNKAILSRMGRTEWAKK